MHEIKLLWNYRLSHKVVRELSQRREACIWGTMVNNYRRTRQCVTIRRASGWNSLFYSIYILC